MATFIINLHDKAKLCSRQEPDYSYLLWSCIIDLIDDQVIRLEVHDTISKFIFYVSSVLTYLFSRKKPLLTISVKSSKMECMFNFKSGCWQLYMTENKVISVFALFDPSIVLNRLSFLLFHVYFFNQYFFSSCRLSVVVLSIFQVYQKKKTPKMRSEGLFDFYLVRNSKS